MARFPRCDPLPDAVVRDAFAAIEGGECCHDARNLPFVSVEIRGDSLGREERAGASRGARHFFEAFLERVSNAHGDGCGTRGIHNVYIVSRVPQGAMKPRVQAAGVGHGTWRGVHENRKIVRGSVHGNWRRGACGSDAGRLTDLYRGGVERRRQVLLSNRTRRPVGGTSALGQCENSCGAAKCRYGWPIVHHSATGNCETSRHATVYAHYSLPLGQRLRLLNFHRIKYDALQQICKVWRCPRAAGHCQRGNGKADRGTFGVGRVSRG